MTIITHAIAVVVGLAVATVYHKKFSKLAKDAKRLADKVKGK